MNLLHNFFNSKNFNYYALLTFFLLAFVSSGCRRNSPESNGKPDTNEAPSQGDWVVQHLSADAENLNPSVSSDASSSEIFRYLYEKLAEIDPVTLVRKPIIAESLPNDTGNHLQYDFTIKKEAVFSDGKPITADDFIFYLKTLKNPALAEAEPHRGYLTDVYSAEKIDNDPKKIRFKMKKANCLAVQSITDQLYAVPKHIWDINNLSDKITWEMLDKPNLKNPDLMAFAELMKDATKNSDPKFIVGSGMYKLQELKRNERVVFERNENFWQKGNPDFLAYPDRLVFRTISDYNAALSALKGGELDFISTMPKVLYTKSKPSFPPVKIEPCEYDYPSYDYIGYNAENPIFTDKNVRKALSYAVDRDEIISKIYFGMAKKVQTPLYYKSKESNPNIPLIEFNLDSTKAILSRAGWADSDGDGILDKVLNGKKTPFKFDICLNADNTSRNQVALIFIDALSKLGIKATVTGLEWSILLKRLKNHEYDATVSGWATDVFENDQYQLWHSSSAAKGGSNYISFKNKRADELIIKMRTEFDYAKRTAMNHEFQQIINDEQPCTFLISALRTGARSNRFNNVTYFSDRPGYSIANWWVASSSRRYGGAKETN